MKNNHHGFSLVELMVTLAVLSIISMVMGQILVSNTKSIWNLEYKNEVAEFDSEMTILLTKQSQCESSFRNGNRVATYSNGTTNTNRVMIGENLFFQLSQTPRGYRTFTVENIQLTDSGIPPTPGTYVNSNQREISGNNHILHLAVTVEPNSSGGTTKQIRKTLRVFTDSNNRIRTCNVRAKTTNYRALATRYMPAIQHHYCSQPVPPEYYLSNAGPSCPDTDGDLICDNRRSIAVNEHPLYTWSPGRWEGSRWENSFPTRNESYWGPQLIPGPEGRCPTSVSYNESTEHPSQIFILRSPTAAYGDNEGVMAEGLGCNNSNGWRITGCAASGNSIGNTVSQIGLRRGEEFCMTRSHLSPHASKGEVNAWWTRNISIQIICEKEVEE